MMVTIMVVSFLDGILTGISIDSCTTSSLVEVVELCRHSWWSGVQLPIGTMVVPSFFMAMAWKSP